MLIIFSPFLLARILLARMALYYSFLALAAVEMDDWTLAVSGL
jgi:hypothetical protein